MKIALLGSATPSKWLAPFNDKSWEVWACSPANCDLPRSDVFFEIHGIETTLKKQEYADFVGWCKKHPKIYMQEVRPEFPGSIAYPKDEMVKEFGPYFWKSSVDYMMALAISMKPEVIGLWGIEMTASDEYAHQRPGCQHYIHEAQQRGIKIVAPPESDILHPAPMYGYRETSPGWWRMNARWCELAGKQQAIEAEIAKLQEAKSRIEGAMEDANYVCNTFRL
jgi:hypothetical protein